MARSNKANRDAFVSIPAEVKEMLRHVIPAVQQMPKIDRIDELNRMGNKAAHLDEFLSSMNSYFGLLKQRTDHRRMLALRDAIDPDWWTYLRWNGERCCVSCREGFTWRDRMNRKYHLKLKYNGKRRTRSAA